MPTPTYTPLATYTVTGSSDAQVVFSSIPTTYRDLIIVFNGTASGDENLTPTFNGSGVDFTWVQMTTGPGSNAGTNNSIGRVAGGSRTIGMLQIFDYAQTDKHKTFFVQTNVTGTERRQLVARWAQTTAINSVGLAIRTGITWSVGSTFALYGIEA